MDNHFATPKIDLVKLVDTSRRGVRFCRVITMLFSVLMVYIFNPFILYNSYGESGDSLMRVTFVIGVIIGIPCVLTNLISCFSNNKTCRCIYVVCNVYYIIYFLNQKFFPNDYNLFHPTFEASVFLFFFLSVSLYSALFEFRK